MAKSTAAGDSKESPVSLSPPAVDKNKAAAPPEKPSEPRRFVVCRSGWLARHFGYVPTTTETLVRQRGFDPDACVAQGLLKPIS